jgi:hypothetical protein
METPADILVWTTAAALLAAAVLTLARILPAQNIAMILGSLAAYEAALETVQAGPHSLWRGLLLWPATIVLARAGCRWILRSWRRDWNYGLLLIVMAGATAALVEFAVTPSGSRWAFAAKLAAIRFASTALCLFVLSPWFISKLPHEPRHHAR